MNLNVKKPLTCTQKTKKTRNGAGEEEKNNEILASASVGPRDHKRASKFQGVSVSREQRAFLGLVLRPLDHDGLRDAKATLSVTELVRGITRHQQQARAFRR